jgi:hypothetical protein
LQLPYVGLAHAAGMDTLAIQSFPHRAGFPCNPRHVADRRRVLALDRTPLAQTLFTLNLRSDMTTPSNLIKSSRLKWLWITTVLGGLLGFATGIMVFLALRTLPIPGLHEWFLRSFSLIGLSLLFIGWLTGLGFLVAQSITGLLFWSGRLKEEDDPVARLSGTIGFSACASLASSAAFLLSWKAVPHAPYLALGWPIVASLLQLFLLGAGTPWLLVIAKASQRLSLQGGAIGPLLHTIFEQIRMTVKQQLPRVLIALHATGLSFALWISPIAQSLEFRNTHHPLISLLQGLVLVILFLGHLWLARSALLASLRNGIAQRVAAPLAQLAHRLPSPPPEILQLFRPPQALTPWLRLPWTLLANRFSPIIDRWEEWTQATHPAERLREFLSTEVPGLTGPVILAILQILTALLPPFFVS